MAIDMNPAEGRIILGRARSTEFFPWYEKGGKITRIAGKRIYYKDETGAEKFLHEFAAIVDTKEEYDLLLDFTKKGKAQLWALHDSLTRQQEALTITASVVASVKRTRKPG